MQSVYIVSMARTPIGSFGGSLSTVSATQLGAAAIRGALTKANIDSNLVQAVYMGNVVSANLGGRREFAFALILGGAIGFYDGFFGPGTGSFLIFLFIRFFGFDFLHASAASKVVNVATNLAALGFFVPNGHILPVLAVLMATCNVLGSLLGTHLALRHGSGFVRKAFVGVVGVFILKFAYDSFA